MAAFISCDIFPKDTEEKVVESESNLEIIRSSLAISATGGEAYVVLENNRAADVTVDESWCSYEKRDTAVVFFATENPTIESRYAKVVFTSEDKTATVTLHQFGYKSTSFNPKDFLVKAEGETINLPYEYDFKMVATASEPWIKLDITEDSLNITVEENTIQGTPENPSREGKISWQLGAEKGEFAVIQMNQSFMKEDSNWKVYYDGLQSYQGEDAAFIRNDVTTPGISGKYGFHVIEKSDFEESGMEIGDYIATYCAAEFKADLDEAIEYYSAMGYDLTYDDFLYEESDYEIYDPFDDGDYIALAIGFDSDLSLTGHFAYSAFTVKTSGGDQPTGYEAWLGEWEIQRGSVTDTWTITEKVKGQSYNINGFEGDPKNFGPIEALYQNDQLIIMSQSDMGTFDSSYGKCTIRVLGRISIDGGMAVITGTNGEIEICSAKMTGNNKATLTPATARLQEGEFVYEDIIWAPVILEGEYAGYYLTLSKEFTALPNTLTKKGGSQGGGDDDPGNASEQFKKWLGTWSVPDDKGETFDITIKSNEPDKSFAIRGWEIDEDFIEDIIAPFDASQGTLTLHVNTKNPIAENVDIGKSSLYNLFYYGTITYLGEEYVVGGDYDAAKGTIESEGTAIFKSCQITLQGITGDFDVENFVLTAVNVDDDQDIITWSGESTGFPLTITKKSSGKSALSVNPVSGKTGEWVKVNTKPLKAMSTIKDESIYLMNPHEIAAMPINKFKRSSK